MRLLKSLWFLAAAMASVVSAAPLTLHDAQDLLFRNHTAIRSAEVELKKAYEERTETRSAWLPSIDAKGSWQWVSERNRIVFDMPSLVPGADPLAIDRTIGTNTRTEVGIDCSYPLFTGFARKYDSEAKNLQIEQRKDLLESARNRAALALGLIYLQWQLAYREVAVRRELCGSLDAVVQQTRIRFEAGAALKSHLLDAQARRRMVEVDLAGALQKTDSLRCELLALITSEDSTAVPDTMDLSDRFAVQAQRAVVDTVRPELRALRQSAAQIGIMRDMLHKRHLPRLFGMAGVRYANPGLAMGSDRFMGYGLAGVQLNWSLFDGLKGRIQERELVLKRELVEIEYRRTRDDFGKRLDLSLRRIEQAARRYDAAREASGAARRLAEDLGSCVEAGTATQVDYLNALVGATQAELIEQQLKTARGVAALQALYAAGVTMEF